MLQDSMGRETGCFVLKDRAIASFTTSQLIIKQEGTFLQRNSVTVNRLVSAFLGKSVKVSRR